MKCIYRGVLLVAWYLFTSASLSSGQDNLVDSAVRVVSLEETVVLDCNLNLLNSTVVWLGQRWGEVPFIILTKENNIDRYFIGYNQRFSIVHNLASNLSRLKICNITASDLGLFYCVQHFLKVSMVIGSFYNLTLTGKYMLCDDMKWYDLVKFTGHTQLCCQ